MEGAATAGTAGAAATGDTGAFFAPAACFDGRDFEFPEAGWPDGSDATGAVCAAVAGAGVFAAVPSGAPLEAGGCGAPGDTTPEADSATAGPGDAGLTGDSLMTARESRLTCVQAASKIDRTAAVCILRIKVRLGRADHFAMIQAQR